MPTDANNPGGGADAPEPQELELTTDAVETDDAEIEQEGDEPTPVDDTEEIDYDGVKHKIPKALKGAFLMHQDYTRKTQEVAEQRRTFEESQRSYSQQAAMREAQFRIAGRVAAFEDALAPYENVDWQTLRANNRDLYEYHKDARDQLRDAHAKASRELSEKAAETQRASEAETANRKTKLSESLARDIPGYAPELASKMQTFGVATYGFSADEISATTDPRLHRLMYDAMLGREATQKAAKSAAAVKTAQTAEAVKPPAQVGNRAQSSKVSPTDPRSDRLSDDEWVRRRREQMRTARA